MVMSNGCIELSLSEDDDEVGYVSLPSHPGSGKPGIVAKTISLRELIGGYTGPDINLDFSAEDVLLGIEIVD